MGLIWLVASFLLLVVSSCQPNPAAGVALDAPTATPGATETAAKPALIVTVAAPTAEMPSFGLPTPVTPHTAAGKIASGTASVPSPVATDAPPATATPTPPPTFTPPALPFTSPLEHYWLRRPVPEGDAVWTDKAYPYGNTRGGMLRPHHGVEFNVSRGTEILAAASGTVVVSGDDATVAYGPHTNFYGNLVVIELDSRLDGRSVYTLYGHLSQVLVSVGQSVQAQEVIALSGASGVADGPHMHFEVRVGENSYDNTRNPLLWLYPFPDRGTVAGRVTWPNGELAQQAPVRLRRVDAPSRYAATTTYAGKSVNGDDGWDENFALDDVDAGYYEIVVEANGEKFKENVWVYPYRTSFVEIVLDSPSSTVD